MENQTPTEEQQAGVRQGYMIGTYVFGALMVLTLLEYFIAVSEVGISVILLSIIALAKAGLIVQFFMHIYRLWSDEEGH